VNTDLFPSLRSRPLAWLSALVALGGLVTVALALRRRRDLQAFLGSCGFLGGMLAATAASIFPVMLRSIGGAGESLTAYNASVPTTSLRIAFSSTFDNLRSYNKA
jgi:cytochrome d ubiquinol oxidase subunit II